MQNRLLRLTQRAQSGTSAVSFLIDGLPPEVGSLLRKCAIPHQFNPALLRILDPALSEDNAAALYDRFRTLSIVVRTPDGLGLHDNARGELFASWLSDATRSEFAAINSRLVNYFWAELDEGGGDADRLRRRYVFHLIGANQQAGYEAFRQAYDEYRSQFRPVVCENLIHLMHEYDTVLDAALRHDLAYREAKLALDQNDPGRAITLLQPLIDSGTPPPFLRIKMLNSIGTAYRQQRRWRDAETVLAKALDLVEKTDSVRDTQKVLLNLSLVETSIGEIDRAESRVQRSLDLAMEANDRAGIANALNSLGTIRRREGDIKQAISRFEESLRYVPENDFDRAAIYNNIGLCYADLRSWNESESHFRRSLSMKEKAGDVTGQAGTLMNLARLQKAKGADASALMSAGRAIELFEQIGDSFGLGTAHHATARIHPDGSEDAGASLTRAVAAFGRAGADREREKAESELAAMTRRRRVPAWVTMIFFFLLTILSVAVFGFLLYVAITQ